MLHNQPKDNPLQSTTVDLLVFFHPDKTNLLNGNSPLSNAQFVNSLSKSLKDPTYTYFKSAWHVYSGTVQSTSTMPAMLYKIRDKDIAIQLAKSYQFFTNNDLTDEELNGRIYRPKKHNWQVNQVWCLAQLHKGRDFHLYSALCALNFRRHFHTKEKPSGYSAFAKEIAIAIYAGYYVHINPQTRLVELIAPNYSLKHLSINDISLTDAQIKKATTFVLVTSVVYANPGRRGALYKPPFETLPQEKDSTQPNPNTNTHRGLPIMGIGSTI